MSAPTREIVDDYMGMIDAGLCAKSCGAARDDICVCRCGGEFHNLLRDWWSSSEYRETGEHWCVSCQKAHAGGLAPSQYVLNCAALP